jgi:Regulator of ribonuclease activity B
VADAIEQTLPPVPGVVPADWIRDNVAEVDEMNSETWETLTASGVGDGATIRLDFAFSTPIEQEAGDLAEYLVTSAEYEATAMPPQGEMDLWTVEGTTRDGTVTAAGIEEWVRRMIAVGWQHGEATLDGWSAVLG